MSAADDIGGRLSALEARGTVIVDPRQTYVGPDVDPGRVGEGVTLHPGTRLQGSRTRLLPGAEVGREGPTTLVNCVLGPRARVDGGYAEGAVLLRDARVGSGAHLRAGTLLEEEASAAHTVGLKHTILLSFVTIGSLVNLCDCLMAGGTSRRDHSEVGSGFIHFNFTPWGTSGDKATPSLVGDVVRGVFLRQRRIFLGGAGGMVGPRTVGYGGVAAAGQVLREDVPEDRVVLRASRPIDRNNAASHLDAPERRGRKNLAYVGQLVALRTWYREVRLARARTHGEAGDVALVEAAMAVLGDAIDERIRRLNAFLDERGVEPVAPDVAPAVDPCPLPLDGPADHVAWVQALPGDLADVGEAWLRAVVDGALAPVPEGLRPQ